MLRPAGRFVLESGLRHAEELCSSPGSHRKWRGVHQIGFIWIRCGTFDADCFTPIKIPTVHAIETFAPRLCPQYKKTGGPTLCLKTLPLSFRLNWQVFYIDSMMRVPKGLTRIPVWTGAEGRRWRSRMVSIDELFSSCAITAVDFNCVFNGILIWLVVNQGNCYQLAENTNGISILILHYDWLYRKQLKFWYSKNMHIWQILNQSCQVLKNLENNLKNLYH